MSLRHLRKFELQGTATEVCKGDSKSIPESADESSDISVAGDSTTTRKSVFLLACGSDFQVSEADSSVERAARHNPEGSENVSSSPANSCPREVPRSSPPGTGRKRRKRLPKAASVEKQKDDCTWPTDAAQQEATQKSHAACEASEERKNTVNPSCLCMEKSAFDPEVDLRRMFGREVVRSSRIGGRSAVGSIRSRRHWLVAPIESTPLVNPWMRMVASEDPGTRTVEFSIHYTEEYVRMQPTFYTALHSHDPHVLSEFCRANRHHPDGLLALAQSLTVAERHELAFEALTEAVVSMQCAFHYSFSPFAWNPDGTPQVAVDSRNPLNRQLFACLALYMLGLGEQGCHRCSLEVCKLLLAMDLSNDVSHSLLHIDYYAIRSRKYDFLQFFARTFVEQHLTYVVPLYASSAVKTCEESNDAWRITDLRLALPNFAYSAALASFMQITDPEMSSITRTKAEDICTLFVPEGEIRQKTHLGPAVPHLLLMHAIILFPTFVRRLLERLKIKGEQKVKDSLYPDVPWDTLLFALPLWTQGFPSHRREHKVHDHLVACLVEKNHDLWRAGVIIRWLHSCAAHLFTICRDSTEQQLLLHYKTSWASSDFLIDLSRYTGARVSEFSKPATLPSALMEVESDQSRVSRRPGLRQQLSLRSSPVVLFFQTLLPWNELDLTGLRAEPLFVFSIVSNIWSVCGAPVEAAVRALQAIGTSTVHRFRLILNREGSRRPR